MRRDARIVFLVAVTLAMTGVVMIYSSSAVYAYMVYGDSLYFVKRHLLFVGMGIAAAVTCMQVTADLIRDKAKYLIIAALLLLVVVLIPGIGFVGGGARRWIRVFGGGFQPSEFAKLAMILYLADFTSRKRYEISRFIKGFLPPFLVVGLAAGLVLLEPDMGSAVAIGVIASLMLFISGTRIKHLLIVAAGALPVMFVVVASAPYRLQRIVTFLKPWEDPRGAGFQLIQSFIALGSGGIFGVGLGGSRQKLFFLPQSHTDFIYSIIGEELGLFGATAILILFALLVWFSLKISFKLKELFAARVVFGISVMIAFEAIVNIGVSAGAVPTKGLPLPFISYGGSSLVMHFAAIGILLNMARKMEDA
ncbi:MAG: putative lipid II flippase FtsW [Candidatus Omnitrophica bacterium]|nr:putative lipid II flippase FtsW [Candidatus Omnitrophota bacterium]